MYPSRRRRRPRRSSPEQFARGLGWLSVGLGVAQVLAPRAMSKLAGLPVPAALMMLCGARELLCGTGLLTQEQPATWMRARMAGDAVDLAALGVGLLLPRLNRRRIGVADALVGGVAAADFYCNRQLADYVKRSPRHVVATIDVASPPDEVYRFWRDLENLPRLIPRLESVQMLDDLHSHWIATGPDGMRTEWDAEIIDDAPDARLAWRSVEGSQIYNAGSLELERIAGGTRLRVELLYEASVESLPSALAKLFGVEPRDDMQADLRAFKELIESRGVEA